MGHSCGYFLGTSFSKICNFNREFKTKSFRGRISIICRSSVAAIYQNKPLSPVSFFNCRNGLLPEVPFKHFDSKKDVKEFYTRLFKDLSSMLCRLHVTASHIFHRFQMCWHHVNAVSVSKFCLVKLIIL